MNKEVKRCQNCEKEFTIEPEDFAFYEKIKVPAPTWCPDCRLQRRMAFRNERTLYKRKCQAPGHEEEVISVFSPDNEQRVYDHKEWWGDNWDGIQYAREVNFSKPFLQQVGKLWKEVPDVALLNINSVNSDYCSITEGNKNCYLVVGGDFNEDVSYSAFIFNSKDCMDTYWVSKSELNYETVDCIQCFRLLFSRYCKGCYDSTFLFNCRNCDHCFGCTNLVSKSYQIFNVQYSKEEYLEKLKKYDISNHAVLQEIKNDFHKKSLVHPRRFAYVIHSTNSSGDNLEGVKNCKLCFDVFGGAEECRFIWLAYSAIKDCFDCDHLGLQSEINCECSTIYPGNRTFFSRFIFDCHYVDYSYNCHNSSNLFGCIGLRHKQYCILNKQYTKEEYGKLIPKIIEHMNDTPYTDKKGRIYKYGEFFPPELSPFAYNETVAQEYFPLTKEETLEQGYTWKDPEKRTYQITIKAEDLPDYIKDVDDSILEQIIGCEHEGKCNEQCTEAFKIIPQELEFYRKINLPLPRLCPNCRHYQRIKQRNPLKLWHRKCQCAGEKSDNGVYKNTIEHTHHGKNHCPNELETTYSPDRKEIVYCEKCYQAEVI